MENYFFFTWFLNSSESWSLFVSSEDIDIIQCWKRLRFPINKKFAAQANKFEKKIIARFLIFNALLVYESTVLIILVYLINFCPPKIKM